MRVTLSNLSIKQRLTLSYILFILIPFCVLAMHTYGQTRAYQKDQSASNMSQTLTILKNGLEGKLNLVESISHNITFNTSLQSFLSDPFNVQNGSMDQYIQFIKPIVYYGLQYNQVEVSSIRVYMNNTSIPEGFGSFYSSSDVEDTDWYNSFIHSKRQSAWLAFPNEGSYAYLQKIVTMEGEFLGVTSVSILKQNLLNSLDDSNNISPDIYVADANHQLLYGSSAIKQSWGSAINDKKQFEQHGKLYVQDHIEQLGFTIGIVSQIPVSLRSYQLLTTFGFIAAIVLSILVFYQVLKTTFIKIKASIRAMDHSIRTGFTELIPVERNDEIGVISEKFNTLLAQINTLVEDLIRHETVHKDAQLKALQAQINPHFIYNTINLFSAKTELAGLYDVSEAFADFGRMLRYNMNNQAKYSTVQQEIQHVVHYIQLQKLKYGDRLQFNWYCETQLINAPVIRFILQPIVENSITHGMRNRNNLRIRLDIDWNDRGEVRIHIQDDGSGINTARLSELNLFFHRRTDIGQPLLAHDTGEGNGIGLGNINDRLRMFYGDAYAIHMDSIEGSFTQTILTIPFQEETAGK
ncbi:sensor histidine kinase [Paenibacillus aurantiacus]|uniref:Sensor histidine kinase n=1 Tax=Paenibacillus aurantiacus TaxID=1936118 RepID=A0ABV5KS18_9BACL